MNVRTLAFLEGYLAPKQQLQKSAASMPNLHGGKDSFLKGLFPNAKIAPAGMAEPTPADVGTQEKLDTVNTQNMGMTTGQDAM